VFRQNAVDSGVITFNVDGTGTSVGRSKTMNISALPSSTTPSGSIMSISEFKVPFTYAIDADNTVDISFGVVHFDVVDGGGTGNSGPVSARNAKVQIGNGAITIVGAPATEIEQETVVNNILNDGTLTQYRICVRSGPDVRK